MKKYQIYCPYCGSPAILSPANKVHGSSAYPGSGFLYVCSRWPACDAYVSAHKRNRQPMGTLANARLRRKRIQAHKALDAFRKNRHMERWAAYVWLQGKLNLEPSKAHIGMFSEKMCDKVIACCQHAPPPPHGISRERGDTNDFK